MKRLLAFLAAAILLAGAVSFAGAEEERKRLTNSEGFVYEIKDDGTAVIVGYTGKEKNLAIPETVDSVPVTEIGSRAFYTNRSIKTAVVPGCVKTVGDSAFGLCSALASAEFQEGVETLGNNVFWQCKKLKEVTFPMSVSEAKHGILSGCTNMKTLNVPENHPYFALKDGVLFSIPDQRLIWYPAAKKDKEYTVPDGTAIIDRYAFETAKVTGVSVPESVTEIRGSAFTTCKKLKSLDISKGVASINGIFWLCDKIEKIGIPEGHPTLMSVDGVIFSRDPQELVFYPKTKKDKSYTVPDGTVKIVGNAFEGSRLVSVEIPGSVKEIEGNAFEDSRKLKTVVLHEGVETFGSYPFQWCSALTEITLPASLVNVKESPFLYCSRLKTITVAEGNPALAVVDGVLVNRSTKTLLCYPISRKGKSYTAPEGIETIPHSAFAGAKIGELILPEGVISLKAVAGMKSLKKMTLPSSLETIELHKSNDLNLSRITFTVVPGSYAENYCQAYKLKYGYAE